MDRSSKSLKSLNRSGLSNSSSRMQPRAGKPKALKVLQKNNVIMNSKSSANLRHKKHSIDPYVPTSTPAETSDEHNIQLINQVE